MRVFLKFLIILHIVAIIVLLLFAPEFKYYFVIENPYHIIIESVENKETECVYYGIPISFTDKCGKYNIGDILKLEKK